MKKLLPVLILILIGCSEQDRYEMYSPSIRIDKRNGEYEYKICGKWYVPEWIESENLKKEFSNIPKDFSGRRIVNNDTRKIIKIYYEYISSFTYSLNSGQVTLCPGESKNLDVGLHESFNVVNIEILKTGLFNS